MSEDHTENNFIQEENSPEPSDDGQEEEDLYERFSIQIDPLQTPIRIDKFLVNRMAQISRNRLQQAAQGGYLRVNEQTVKPNYKVKPGDQVRLVLPRTPSMGPAQPEAIPLNIAYEDEDVIVVDKPAGMVVHPGVGNPGGTLVNGLLHYLGRLPGAEHAPVRPGLVHRIDKDTSGLLVVAKNEAALSRLAGQFAEHTIEREYEALVWGAVESDEGTIDVPLGRDPRHRQRHTAFPDRRSGKEAVTHYRVLERFVYASRVACRLETGRTHQIRVHMKHLGHPLFADATYGGDQLVYGPSFSRFRQFVRNTFQVLQRQALHAAMLGWVHPRSGERMRFRSPLPPDIEKALDRWRRLSAQLERGDQFG